MDSRNQKQEELIRRLEDIRRQRTSIHQEEMVEQPMKRNERSGKRSNRNRQPQQRQTTKETRQASSNRNRNAQRTARTSVERAGQHSQEMQSSEHLAPAPRSLEMQIREQRPSLSAHEPDRRIRQAKIREKVQAKGQKVSPSKKKKNPLIDQLSDKDRLRQAIILNEVLSKPIALKRYSR